MPSSTYPTVFLFPLSNFQDLITLRQGGDAEAAAAAAALAAGAAAGPHGALMGYGGTASSASRGVALSAVSFPQQLAPAPFAMAPTAPNLNASTTSFGLPQALSGNVQYVPVTPNVAFGQAGGHAMHVGGTPLQPGYDLSVTDMSVLNDSRRF